MKLKTSRALVVTLQYLHAARRKEQTHTFLLFGNTVPHLCGICFPRPYGIPLLIYVFQMNLLAIAIQ